MKRSFSLLILICFLICFYQIQTGFSQSSIIGTVINQESEPVPFANIVLYSSADSTMVKVEASNELGTYKFEQIAPGNYWLKFSFLGLNDYNSSTFQLTSDQDINLPATVMETAAVTLTEVEVKAQRPIIEVQPDKLVFNIDGSINATGNNALELLQKSPGVIVDNNDNIILSGKNGVLVYIDGKPSYLSTQDLAIRLKAMQASEIDAIEIITNPSAKYDAEGNAGIINIRMKKDKSLGTNANVNLGTAYGQNLRTNANMSVNNRSRKFNVFGTYSGNTGDSWNWMDLYRIQNNILYDEKTESVSDGFYNSLRMGTDIFTSKNSTIGFLVNGYLNDRNWTNTSKTPIIDLETNNAFSFLDASTTNDGMRKRFNSNINYSFDNRQGQSWNIDLDWGIFRNDNDVFQPNYYKTPDQLNILDERIYSNNTNTNIDIYTVKMDHTRSLLGWNFGTGVKISYVQTDNTLDFFNLVDGVSNLDIDRSNNFVFEENINAAYLSLNRQIDKFTLSLGLRAEHTNSTGTLTAMKETDNDEVIRNYFDIFPSGGISYSLNRTNQFRINFSQRIDRPNYQDLNPFEYRLSELSYSRGNPFLRPQYTNSLSLGHTHNYRLNTTLSYSYTNDFFANISDSTEVTRTNYETINLGYQRTISLNVSYPFSPKSWWNTYTSFNGYRTQNYADLGEGREINIIANVLSVYHQSTFTIANGYSFELSGLYSSPGIHGAVYKTDGYKFINLGVQKNLFNGRSSLKITLTDVFDIQQWRGVQDFSGFYVDASGGAETRQLRVNFSYLFGSNTVKKNRKRNTGLDAEAGRIN